MTAMTRSSEMAASFARVNDEVIGLVSDSTEEQWDRTTEREGWTVAATAHHVAIVQQAFVGVVERLMAGETIVTTTSVEELNRLNAEHAREFAKADQAETLDVLNASGAELVVLIGQLDDEMIQAHAGTFGGNDFTLGQVIENIVTGHAREHFSSIQETIGR